MHNQNPSFCSTQETHLKNKDSHYISIKDKSLRQKLKKEITKLKEVMIQMDLRDIYKVFKPNTKNTQIYMLLRITMHIFYSGALAVTQNLVIAEKLK